MAYAIGAHIPVVALGLHDFCWAVGGLYVLKGFDLRPRVFL